MAAQDQCARGLDALAPRPHTGRKRELTEQEDQEVARRVTGGDPRQYGFDFGPWTREIISHLIAWRLGVESSVSSVELLLHRQGVTPQSPLRRACERNPEAVERWLDTGDRGPGQAHGARISRLDAAAPRSDDPSQRTWGGKGETQVVATSGRRQAISAMSAVTNRGAFWYHVYSSRLNADKFIECLRNLLSSQRGSLIVIMDGHPVDKVGKVRQRRR